MTPFPTSGRFRLSLNAWDKHGLFQDLAPLVGMGPGVLCQSISGLAQGTSRSTRRLGRGIAACGTPSALCWSPVREGTYDILDCVNLATGHYASINVRLAIQAWGTPSAWRHVPRPLIRWVIRSEGFIRALPVPSLPNSCHQPCCLLRTSPGERVRGVSGPAQNVPHRVLLVSLGVLGRELLPAASRQPCAGAPSGRGHTIFWTVLTWPQDIMPASMSALQYRHEAPPRHGAMCRGPSFGGLSGRWVLSEPCQYLPCPILATNLVVCYVFFHCTP